MSPAPPGGDSCDVHGPSVHSTPPPEGGGLCDVPGPRMDTGGPSPMLVNGLLCSIKRAMTRCANRKELAQVIDKGTDEVDLKEAWTMLFTLFSDAEDKV